MSSNEEQKRSFEAFVCFDLKMNLKELRRQKIGRIPGSRYSTQSYMLTHSMPLETEPSIAVGAL